MIEFIDTPPWTSDDTIALRTFLTSTETGKKLLPNLAKTRVALLPSGETNAILITSGRVMGFDAVISELLRLSSEFPEPERQVRSDSLPSLEDDAAWPGPKLNPTE